MRREGYLVLKVRVMGNTGKFELYGKYYVKSPIQMKMYQNALINALYNGLETKIELI